MNTRLNQRARQRMTLKPPMKLLLPRACVEIGEWKVRTVLEMDKGAQVSKARFRRRSFHEQNLICILGSAYEKIGVQFETAQPFFSPGLAGNFDSGTVLERLCFRRRTFHVPNQMHKL